MEPPFSRLQTCYPRKESREVLFNEIGWGDLIDNRAYWDTCAIRMSYALLRVGMSLSGGRMKVNAGKLKGKCIEPGQAKLSRMLEWAWGKPEVYKGEQAARDGIGRRHGVVSFFRIEGGNGGHIDLISMGDHGFLDCARSCFFSAATVWFWPLD